MSSGAGGPVAGTRGYAAAADRFLAASDAISFEELHAAVLPHLPDPPGRVLDAGAGSGRDALELARRGYRVLAVEPLRVFREAAARRDGRNEVEWRDDALPGLETLSAEPPFDFVLCHAVWHHLPGRDQGEALARFAQLLRPGGRAALGLRHGPAGVGTHTFPVDVNATAATATELGFEVELRLEAQASLLPGKPDVTWSRLVLRRVESVAPAS